MYDDQNYCIRREAVAETAAGAAAVSCKFAHFQKLRLKAAHAIVTTAGTSAGAGNSVIVKNGTTAVATFTLGTNTAGSTVSIQNINSDVPSLTQLTATNGTDATGKALIVYEYELSQDGTKSP